MPIPTSGDSSGAGTISKDPGLPGGGGRFGGGGASGTFDVSGGVKSPAISETLVTEGAVTVTDTVAAAGDGASSGALDLAAAAWELPHLSIVAVILILFISLFAVFGGIGTVIAGLETMLSEVLFASILPASLLLRIRGLRDEHWSGILWKSTRFPLYSLLLLSFFVCFMVKSMNPEAVRLLDIFRAQ